MNEDTDFLWEMLSPFEYQLNFKTTKILIDYMANFHVEISFHELTKN